jgi:predicted acetyltransferase
MEDELKQSSISVVEKVESIDSALPFPCFSIYWNCQSVWIPKVKGVSSCIVQVQ